MHYCFKLQLCVRWWGEEGNTLGFFLTPVCWGNFKPKGQIISCFKSALLYPLSWNQGDLFQGPVLHLTCRNHNNMVWCIHPPPRLPSIMLQKPHKNWVLQPPPWASHSGEIRPSFPQRSWPLGFCILLPKSHKMKMLTEVIPSPFWGGCNRALSGTQYGCIWDLSTPQN